MRLDFSSEYDCVEYNADSQILILKAKTKSVAYDKLIMKYNAEYTVPETIECYTVSGMLIKTLYFKEIQDFGDGIVRPKLFETDSPLYKGYKSVIIFAEIKKKEIDDEIFTVNSMNKITELQ
jgi:hypothetical protein